MRKRFTLMSLMVLGACLSVGMIQYDFESKKLQKSQSEFDDGYIVAFEARPFPQPWINPHDEWFKEDWSRGFCKGNYDRCKMLMDRGELTD